MAVRYMVTNVDALIQYELTYILYNIGNNMKNEPQELKKAKGLTGINMAHLKRLSKKGIMKIL